MGNTVSKIYPETDEMDDMTLRPSDSSDLIVVENSIVHDLHHPSVRGLIV